MKKIGVEDAGYPRLLKEIEINTDLWVVGDEKLLKQPMVAVVGSRKVSEISEEKVRVVVKELVGCGFVIVSGMAKGIDGMAHREALRLGGKTVGVLAHGLNMIYPPEHRELAKEIIKKGGTLVSPFAVGVRPEKQFFLERNRVMVGMSAGLVVVEAGVYSGSMASANRAAEYGRQVWACPGSPGTDLLIEEGVEEWKV